MIIDTVDFFYLSMPEVRDIGDGSQDALLVRVVAGNLVGWGECEAAPLVCIASWNCPMSHSACKPLKDSVLGQRLEDVGDIRRINALVRAQSMDLLQTDHTLSGIDIALWDLLGKARGQPIWRLLGDTQAYPKTAYASVLFGDDPQSTYRKAWSVMNAGFRAAKFGWGPYGRQSVAEDAEQVRAARAGLGSAIALLVDAGTVWGDDVAAAQARLPALLANETLWLEEPFHSGALGAYQQLAQHSAPMKLAGGEGCHNFHQARNMMDYAAVGFIQIDTGRIGGITTARQVVEHARRRGVHFVNHTFTTHLALSASLQPYIGIEADTLCEYPFEPSTLAREFTQTKILPDAEGRLHLPDGPGLGLEPDWQALQKYRVDVEIRVDGRTIFTSR